jgi:hypothetical protein
MKSRARFLAVLFVAALACGCEREDNRGISDVIAHLKASGFQVGQPEPKMFPLVGAADGCGLMVDGKAIELYRFDRTDSTQRQAMAKMAGAAESMGVKRETAAFGSFVVILHDHPKSGEIVAALKRF